MTLEEIKQELDRLNQNDFEEIKLFIRDKSISNEYVRVLLDALEARYSSFVCPICGSAHIIRNGHYSNGMQKYKCHDCHCTFNIYKDTFLECSKVNLVTWIKYLIIMNEDEDLRDCAQYAGVCLKTSFYMSHKIMNALENSVKDIQLSGITELDDTGINISFSGNHKIHNPNSTLPRKAYKRGRSSLRHREETNYTDNIVISTAVDRNHKVFITIGKIGTTSLSSEEVINIYQPHLTNVSCICTDGCYAYRKLADKLEIELHAFSRKSKEKRGIYHINHVNYVHKVIADYFHIHHGIASKHLNEYLALIAYKCMHKLQDIHSSIYELARCKCDVRWKDYVRKSCVIP